MKIEVIYHPPGTSQDPLIQGATVGLKIETDVPHLQYGAYLPLDPGHTPELLLLAVGRLALGLADDLDAHILREGTPARRG